MDTDMLEELLVGENFLVSTVIVRRWLWGGLIHRVARACAHLPTCPNPPLGAQIQDGEEEIIDIVDDGSSLDAETQQFNSIIGALEGEGCREGMGMPCARAHVPHVRACTHTLVVLQWEAGRVHTRRGSG